MLPPIRYQHFMRILFLPWLVTYESCAGIDKQQWFQEIRHLIYPKCTSNKGNTALDNVLCLLVEVQTITSNASMNSCSIEKALHHFQESCS